MGCPVLQSPFSFSESASKRKGVGSLSWSACCFCCRPMQHRQPEWDGTLSVSLIAGCSLSHSCGSHRADVVTSPPSVLGGDRHDDARDEIVSRLFNAEMFLPRAEIRSRETREVAPLKRVTLCGHEFLLEAPRLLLSIQDWAKL